MKQERTIYQERGRTMVEILFALVIIGILSVVSIYIYLYLMGKHRENETLRMIDLVAAGTYTSEKKQEMFDESGERLLVNRISSGIASIDEYTLDTPLKTHVSSYQIGTGVYEVVLNNVSYGVCQRVLTDMADYVSAYKDHASGKGVYVGDTEEDKEIFCAQVDEFKREVPYLDVPERNENANMILCYSLNGDGCDIPYAPPPPPTDNSCGEVNHGEKYRDCGLCENGTFIMGDAIGEPCYTCGPETAYFKQRRTEGFVCQDSCHVCDGSGNCVLRDADKTEACGDVCCPEGKCNRSYTGCQIECTGGCNPCQQCNTDTGTCEMKVSMNDEIVDDCNVCQDGNLVPVEDGSKEQEDGKCCIGGELKYDATLCPDPATQCSFGEDIYNNGDEIGTCGQCVNGTIKVDTSKETDCQQCNTTTWTLENKEDGSNEQEDGKCCVAGELKYDAALCPDPCPETFTRGRNGGSCGNDTSRCVVGAREGTCSPSGCNGDFVNPYQCAYTIRLNGTVSVGGDGRKQRCAGYLVVNGLSEKILSCGQTKTYNDEVVAIVNPGDGIQLRLYHNSGSYSATNFTATFTRTDKEINETWQSFMCTAGSYYDYSTGKCTTCQAGYYCPGNGSRVKCDIGYYCSGTGNTMQTACSAGTYTDGTGKTSCTTCQAGYYCPGASNRVKCDAGYACAGTGNSTQTACAAGTYSAAGSATCTTCQAGYYCPGNSDRIKCPKGYYCSGTANKKPTICPAGTYCASELMQTPTKCGAGTYNPNAGATASTACQKADIGYYVSGTGNNKQTVCSAGTYTDGTGKSSCTTCQAGYYCPGGSNRVKCGDQQISAAGSRGCSNCPEGQYANSAHTQCGNYNTTYKY